MNAVERLWHYTNNIPQERARVVPEHDPKGPWPTEGHVNFEVRPRLCFAPLLHTWVDRCVWWCPSMVSLELLGGVGVDANGCALAEPCASCVRRVVLSLLFTQHAGTLSPT